MDWPEYIYGADDWPDEVDPDSPRPDGARTLTFGKPMAVFADGRLIWHDPEKTKEVFTAFVESCAEAKAALEQFARDAAKLFVRELAAMLPFQPSLRYAMVGSPYGRNRKGKKRWLFEQKRARRSTSDS